MDTVVTGLIGTAWLVIAVMLLWGALNELGRAVRRCTDCVERWNCGRRAVDCPNEPVFRRAKGPMEASP